MKETYFNEKLEKVSFKRRKDSLLYSRLYSFNVYFIYHTHLYVLGARVAKWVRSLDLTTHTSPSPIRRGLVPSFVNYKKGTLDSQPQVIKFTGCLSRVGGSLRVPQLPSSLKLVPMIYLKYCWVHPF
jgi:hypothetical protein